MRIIAYCFSGTGNTKRVLEALAKELHRLGHEVDIFPLREDCTPPPPNGYRTILVCYPVHAFNTPTPMLRFLKGLPRAYQYTSVYLLRTSGEPLNFNRAAGITPKRILKGKGYHVKGEFRYVMPYNIIFRHSDGMAVRMLRAAERRLPADARLIAAGKGTLDRVGPVSRLVSFVLRIEHVAMPFIGRRFRVSEACIGCGLCASSCPQGNIRMEASGPKFGGNCVSCMSCAFRCPKDAIRISLLDGWRVNGEYSFEGDPASDAEICRYCHKSYVRYFHSIEDNAQGTEQT